MPGIERIPAHRERIDVGKALRGLFLLAAGLFSMVLLLNSLAPQVARWVLGERVMAEVVDSWTEPVGDAEDGVLDFRYFVRYRFTTANGTVITNTAPVSMSEWSGLGEGSRVAVVYFPSRPDRNQLDESRYALLLSCSYVPFLAASGLALVAGFRQMRSLFTRRR